MFVVQFHILNNQHFTAINFLAVQMAHGPLLEFFNISVDPQTNTIALFFLSTYRIIDQNTKTQNTPKQTHVHYLVAQNA